MSKHTPGPYKREDAFVYALTEYRLPTGKVVETNRIWASVCAGHECPKDEAEAVARLFQAAPDLLEALRECRRVMLVEDSLRPGYGWADHVATHVDPAIAKATGETP